MCAALVVCYQAKVRRLTHQRDQALLACDEIVWVRDQLQSGVDDLEAQLQYSELQCEAYELAMREERFASFAALGGVKG